MELEDLEEAVKRAERRLDRIKKERWSEAKTIEAQI